MGDRRRKSSSGDKFSFPIITPLIQDQDNSDFEFGCVETAALPNSPADHLFSNGRLLPRPFPIQPTNSAIAAYSRSSSKDSLMSSRSNSSRSKDSLMSSRSNSSSSKDSLMSSRSNSSSSKDSLMSSRSNSSSSRSSSARTSTSEASEIRRLLINPPKPTGKPPVSRAAVQQYYSSSQRWQFINMPTPAPAPVTLNGQVPRRKKAEVAALKEGSRIKKEADDRSGGISGFRQRIFRSLVSACKECHAIQPSKRVGGQ